VLLKKGLRRKGAGDAGSPGSDLLGFTWHDPTEYVTPNGTTETWFAEVALNFDLLDAALANLACVLTGLNLQSAGTGTYRVRLDGTPGAADGALLVALGPVAHAAYVLPPDTATGAPFVRPAGPHLVKVTGARSAAGGLAALKSFQVAIVEA
jgi:hypothetical protein